MPAAALILALVIQLLAPQPAPSPAPSPGPSAELDAITTGPGFRQPHADLLRLYYAFFDRAPDPDGARYWIDEYNRGETLDDLATAMSVSEEFRLRYGSLNDDAFIDAVYHNVLDRRPDLGGRRYWLNLVRIGDLTRGAVVRWIAANDEFVDAHRFTGEAEAPPGPPPDRPLNAGTQGRMIAVSVEVEPGIEVAGDPSADVFAILGDARSWAGSGELRFRSAPPAEADLRIRIASPATVDRRCLPLRTGGYLSCRNGNSVHLNADRWNTATSWWSTGLDSYRAYLVNHEVGHFLGHGHRSCPGSGEPAPVMQQQSKGLHGCKENGWPLNSELY